MFSEPNDKRRIKVPLDFSEETKVSFDFKEYKEYQRKLEARRKLQEIEKQLREQERQRKEQEKRKRAEKECQENIKRLDYLKSLTPSEFEDVVLELFERLGYSVKKTPAGGDSGIDGILYRDKKKFIIQCKQWKNKVGQPAIRDFYGALTHEKASSGFFVTTSTFTILAQEWVAGKPIELIDGNSLVKLFKNAFP